MRILDLVLNAIIALAAAVFLAYVGLYHFGVGLFTTLPTGVTGIFTRNAALQYVALGLLVAAGIAKVPVGRALRRQSEGRRS